MECEIKPYKQRGNTCAIACMLMILEYLNIIPKANWELEKKYYRIYKSHYMDGTPFSALTWHFAKNNIKTIIIHSEQEIFTNKNNILSSDIYENTLNEYKDFLSRAQEKGVIVLNGIQINCDMLIKSLKEKKLIILAGQLADSFHAILLCSYENDSFIVCDPLFRHKQVKTREQIENFMNTKIGKWCILVSQKID